MTLEELIDSWKEDIRDHLDEEITILNHVPIVDKFIRAWKEHDPDFEE